MDYDFKPLLVILLDARRPYYEDEDIVSYLIMLT